MVEYMPERRRLSANGYWGELPPVAPAYVDGHGASPDTVSFAYMYRVLRRHVWLFLAVSVLGLLGGVYLAFQVPHTYRATAVLRLLNSRRALTGGLEDLTPTIGRYADPLNSTIQLLSSRQVGRAVVDSLGLRLRSATPEFPVRKLRDIAVDPQAPVDSIQLTFYANGVIAKKGAQQVRAAYGSPVVFNTVRFTVPSAPEVETATLKVSSPEVAVDGLIRGLKVLTRPNTDVVDVAYEDPSARQAQRVLNTTIQTFQANNVVSNQESARRRRAFLEGQLRETDSLLKIAQDQLSAFRAEHQIAGSEQELGAEKSALTTLQGQLGDLMATRQTYSALLSKLRSSNPDESAEGLRALAGSPEIANNALVAQQFQQMMKFQNTLDSMTTGPWRSSETNPDLIQLRIRMKNTRRDLIAALSSRTTSLDANIRSLQSRIAAGGTSFQRLPSVAAREMEMSRRVETLSKTSDQQRQDLQNARMAEAVEAGEVQIVSPADVPYLAVWSGGPMRLALGLLFGMLLGGCLAFFLERMNTSIRRPEELDHIMRVPGLAVIPMIQQGDARRSKLAGLLGRGKSGSDENGRNSLGPLPQPLSIGTEAFRMLRTSLVWSESGESLKTIVVTSAAPGEGKTITAANLGVIFAHEGRRVLLVDSDVRRPKLHTMLRVPRSPGLVDLLRSDVDMAELSSATKALDEAAPRSDSELPVPGYIRSTGIRGLYLLPCGRIEPMMADLSSATRLRRLIGDLSKWFDVVILDTPPVLAVADAGILGAMVDGVLLVVRAGQTDRTAIMRAHQHLAQIGANVVGTVFNDPEGEVTGEGGYYYPYDYAAQPD